MDVRLLAFEAIGVIMRLEADFPAGALRALIAHAVLWSSVANTIHNPVHLDVTLGTAARVDASTLPEPTA